MSDNDGRTDDGSPTGDVSGNGDFVGEAAAVAATPVRQKSVSAVDLPTNRGRALAETVVGSILERLTVEASRRGGWLTIEDIEALRREFEGKTAALQSIFEMSFEDYVRARERASWEQARNYPFDRLIVNTFADRFVGEGERTLAEGALSRRVLPGFFLAMGMMLGEEVTEVYQEQCRRIVTRVKKEHGGTLDWEDVYVDKAAGVLTTDAVVAMTLHFEDMGKRAEWFVALINGHLAPPNTAREGAEVADWLMDEVGFLNFFEGFVSSVRDQMATELGKLRMTRMYGAENVALIADILKGLDRALADGLGLKL